MDEPGPVKKKDVGKSTPSELAQTESIIDATAKTNNVTEMKSPEATTTTTNDHNDKSAADEEPSTLQPATSRRSTGGEASSVASPTRTTRILKGKTIFIAGLSPRVAKIHIEKLMQKFGTAVRIDFKDGSGFGGGGGHGGSRGGGNFGGGGGGGRYCFVEFSIQHDAQRAMDTLNGKMLGGQKLIVQPAHERTASSSHTTNNQFTMGENSNDSNPSSSGMSIYKEKKNIDRKIEELRRKIKESQKK